MQSMCAVSTHKSLLHQRTVHQFAIKATNLKGQVSRLSFLLIMGIVMYFLWENFLKAFGSGQSGTRLKETFIVNWCAVLWCRSDLWVETAHSNLPCFALCQKQHWTNNYLQTRKKWPWIEPRLHRKSNKEPKAYVSEVYFYSYACISTF